jgi:Fe-S oxidoreductase
MLEGDILPQDWQSEAVHEALDLCLSCKACKTECPVNVDIAAYKAEFLAHYYRGHRRALRHYAFGFMDKWAHLASLIPGITPLLANLPLDVPGLSHAARALLGIAPRRTLPRFAPRSFQSSQRQQSSSPDRPAVLLWPDTWNNYFHPQTLAAGHEVLANAGFQVQIPRGHICCGRPLYDFGFLTEARAYLERIMDRLAPEIDAGLPIVFLEPSCASVFRDELRNFFPDHPRAQHLREQSFLLSDLLLRHAPNYQPPSLAGRSIILHGHCHQKSLTKMKSEVELLERTGAQVTVLDSGCCGMAGPFGFEKEKFAISQVLAERVLLPAIRAAAPSDILISDGFSCREQISQNSLRRALHLAQILRGDSSN